MTRWSCEAAMDVAEWLRGLGLARYEPAFRDNQIEADVLPSLTVEDLKELGITSVGDRRRLLAAIAALHPKQAAETAALETQSFPTKSDAERRQVTVMFCDLVGSTALSARLDPEDLRDVIGRYHALVRTTIERFQGFVAKYMGDGVLVYFGYPQAHEDDAEQAVRAGLALVDAVDELSAPEPLQVRVGIATGLVVVGDMIGAGSAQEQAIVGETPNLAARLQALAEPNAVVIAESTRRQVGRLFELRDLGSQQLKGYAENQRAWHVLAENRAISRFEALRSGATPLVGREEELELLLRRWGQAKSGSGRVVLISGEPGIGKSRLAEVLAECVAGEQHVRLRYFCSPHYQDSALYPHIAQLERTAGFLRDETDETKLGKLKAVLEQSNANDEAIALIAELLSIETDQRARIMQITPQPRREKTLGALLAQLPGLASRFPVLIIYEDVHWIDPSSRELLDRLIGQSEHLPVLLLVTFRPEFQPPWVGQAHVTSLALARLGQQDTSAMITGIAGECGLPAEIAVEIAERTDGVPLFVEEVTKATIEAGAHAAAALSAVPHTGIPVPPTLHASLMARFDRLGSAAKSIAQKGAAIGREFSYELIASILQRPDAELRDALDRLAGSGLLFVRGVPPESSYIFKHALVQDAAYQSLLRSQRQQLHASVATVLEEQFPEVAEVRPEVLARHCAEAGWVEKAIAYSHRTAQQAIARSAMAEAIAHLHQGLGLLAGLPDDMARRRQELELQTTLGVPLIALKGMAAPEVERAYARARELCLRVEDAPQLPTVLFGLWWFYEVTANLRAAREMAERLLEMAKMREDPAEFVQAHRAMGHTLLWLGEFTPALDHFERAIALYDPAQHRSLAFTSGQEPGVLALGFSAHVLWYLGYPDRALATMRQALSLAREVRHPFSLAFALAHAAWLRQYRREAAEAREAAEEEVGFSGEQGFSFFLAQGTILRGWAVAEQGWEAEGMAEMRQGLAAHEATETSLMRPYWLSLLARACGRSRRAEDGLLLLDEALTLMQGQNIWESELHRLRGELLLGQAGDAPAERQAGRPETNAEGCFHHALEAARRQQARSLELRASTSLARLWRDQGRIKEAYELLSPIYGWFTEGFGTKDLIEAKALLDELGAALGRRSVAAMTATTART